MKYPAGRCGCSRVGVVVEVVVVVGVVVVVVVLLVVVVGVVVVVEVLDVVGLEVVVVELVVVAVVGGSPAPSSCDSRARRPGRGRAAACRRPTPGDSPTSLLRAARRSPPRRTGGEPTADEIAFSWLFSWFA